MAHILHIDSSPRGERSFSRKLSYEFVTAWKNAHPEDTLTYRDLGKNPVPHVDEGWIAAAFTPPEARTTELNEAIKLSDELVDEFLAADRYVFGIPMYNFSVPSTFKAYIDQIVRVNRTFAVTEQGYEGLVYGKKMLVVTASGGSYKPGTPAEQYDYQKPFLQAVFGLVGITDIIFIEADNLSSSDDARQESLDEARAMIEELVANW
ncbi:FMN-dependent NADH-azoreductase [Gloeocapsopsis dulcis]|uniref:FMN dependent NADH:quinone oxidoreductase n=1 Tax=Gloeocapsopsis dulcis AAB1 = 1H9 TaxID=1433147 RepID=A0A6N8FYY4_9CHRO|nr:FMN-dependent NADH-azoreductase [Gloeocapsopsis dulcis]MUL37545.1 FMN-dependent NADH-azoreductase [Gloeocapsopsis dulcis AAB1 = 1H9]WNN87959.1 FMN-dependent NADH-azoreductase [Gloeocapsopsis dulcis]